MAITKTSMLVEFDTSNGAHYVYVPVINHYDASEDVVKWDVVWHSSYSTLGAAQAFFRHWITGEWRDENHCWVGDLRTDFPGGGYQVTLKQCLLLER